MWIKTQYRVTQDTSYHVSEFELGEILKENKGSKIQSIKSLREKSAFTGPFGISGKMGLRDAKEIIEDFISSKTKGR